jgi:alkaline phosphatase D
VRTATCALLLLLPACRTDPAAQPLQRIAFGSCAQQDDPQPIWDHVLEQEPDLFVFMGDNIYADTEDADEMRAKYEQLAAVPGYQQLQQQCPILATWDDHDYGVDDGGAEYPAKEMSKAAFMEFFSIAADAPMRARPGIYDAHVIGPPGQRAQVVLLDTRTFRDPLEQAPPEQRAAGPYVPTTDRATTILGDAQWAWLAEQLEVPAEIRVLVSSIQVVPEEHGWEKWANFPHERERLFQLLRGKRAGGVVIISGDRHHGELSRMDAGLGYPLYDITSSALNQRRSPIDEPNAHRLGDICWPANFGVMDIEWDAPGGALLHLALYAEDGSRALRETVPLHELQPPGVRE